MYFLGLHRRIMLLKSNKSENEKSNMYSILKKYPPKNLTPQRDVLPHFMLKL